MSEETKTVADIFTRKGGTLRLAIFGSLVSAVIYEILDSKYDLSVKTNSGAAISLTSGYERTMTASLDSDTVPSEEFINIADEKALVTDKSVQSHIEKHTKDKHVVK